MRDDAPRRCAARAHLLADSDRACRVARGQMLGRSAGLVRGWSMGAQRWATGATGTDGAHSALLSGVGPLEAGCTSHAWLTYEILTGGSRQRTHGSLSLSGTLRTEHRWRHRIGSVSRPLVRVRNRPSAMRRAGSVRHVH
eukprot:5977097-Prymnesium_polylepis.1